MWKEVDLRFEQSSTSETGKVQNQKEDGIKQNLQQSTCGYIFNLYIVCVCVFRLP